MPDWSYLPVFRPVLFQLPAERARDLALRAMGTLARLPGGGLVIDLLGHMRPDPRLARTFLGITFPTPVGLGPALDVNGIALPAFARFGVGFIEVGPITVDPICHSPSVTRHPELEAITFPAPHPNPGAASLHERLERIKQLTVPLILRLGCRPGTPAPQSTDEIGRMATDLRPYADLFSLDTMPLAVADRWAMAEWHDHVTAAIQMAMPRPLLLVLPTEFDPVSGHPYLAAALNAGVRGVIVDGSVPVAAGRVYGAPARDAALRQVKHLRERYNETLVIVAGGGIHEPVHAREFLTAGANLIQTDTGLIFSGPGLPKRINEAILASGGRQPPVEAPDRSLASRTGG